MKLKQPLTRLNLYLGLALVLFWSLLSASLVNAGGNDGPATGAALQDPPIVYLRYDVDIALKSNGNFVVREIQQIQFNGEYRTAFAEIPRDYTTDITHVRVWEGDTPYTESNRARRAGTYAVDKQSHSIYVEWRYKQTAPGDVRTFTLQYEVVGGLWVYPDETILEWRAVPADRSGFPVLNSQVTIHLPAEVPADDLRYTAYGPEFAAEVVGDQITLTATEPIPDGTRFQVQVGLPPGLVTAQVQPWQIAEDTANLEYRMEAIDVNLAIGRDGQITVTEQQRVAVDAGVLYSGYRNISLAYLDDITDITLFEGEQPFLSTQDSCEAYCFQVDKPWRRQPWIWYDDEDRVIRVSEWRAGEAGITWDFPALVKGEATTFRLEYRVSGAIQVHEDNQRLNWTVVFADRDVPVESASVRIELPPGVAWQEVSVEGGTMRLKTDGSFGLVHQGPIAPKQEWKISLIMPPDATDTAKPAWQLDLEEAQDEALRAEIRRARGRLGAGVAGVLILIGGLLAVWLIWYLRGRDRPTATVAEYLTQPPSDLPPGVVAYLVDEKLTPKGVLASLFHLANLGLLRIDLTDEPLSLQRNWEGELTQGQAIQKPSGETVTIPNHLVTLFNALRPCIPVEKKTILWDIGPEFRRALPTVYMEMGNEAARFFTELPDVARHRWLSLGQWLVLGGIASGVCAWFAFVPNLGMIALAPVVALFPVGLAFMLISRWMPQKTPVGAEEAERWRAFRRYLLNLKNYTDQAEAQKILDDYFAYAVALDVEDVVLKQAEELGSAMPVWTYPARLELDQEGVVPASAEATRRPRSRRLARSLAGRPPSSPPILRLMRGRLDEERGKAAAGKTFDAISSRPSLEGVSHQLGETLADASRSVGLLLNTAVGDLGEDTPFKLVLEGAGEAAKIGWDVTTTTFEVLDTIMEVSSAGGGSGGYSSWSSSSGSRSRWSSSSSRSGSSGRISSSRRSGGGGRRGFG